MRLTGASRSSILVPPTLHPTRRIGSYAFGRRRLGGVEAALQPSFLGWFWRICPFAILDQHPPERPIFRRQWTDVFPRSVVPLSVMQHAVLLGRRSWMRSNESPALTGQYRVDMLPQPGFISVQEHVASGRQVLSLTGVADLEPGDLVGVAHSPPLSFPLDALQHAEQAAEPHPGRLQKARSQLSQVRLPQVMQPRL